MQHPPDKYSESHRRLADVNVRDSADKFPVLNYGTSAHALHDSAGFIKKTLVGNRNYHRLHVGLTLPLRLYDVDFVIFGFRALNRRVDVGFPGFDFVDICGFDFLKVVFGFRIFAENPEFVIFLDSAYGIRP